MIRRNRHEITDYGWLHEQDNQKVIREQEGDKELAWEKGWSTYTKVNDKKCQPAKDWWKENHEFWNDVRSVWGEVFRTKETLAINMNVDNNIMFMRFFSLGNEVSGEGYYDSEHTKKKIKAIIQKHLATDAIKLVMN